MLKNRKKEKKNFKETKPWFHRIWLNNQRDVIELGEKDLAGEEERLAGGRERERERERDRERYNLFLLLVKKDGWCR